MSADPQFKTRRVSNVIIGDVLDLELDKLVRPNQEVPSIWEFEYGRVIAYDRDGEYIYLTFDNGYTEGFPRTHMVRAMTNIKEAGYAQ